MQRKDLIKIAREKVKSFNLEGLKDAGLIPLNGLFFPAIYYPPLTMYPPSSEDEIFANYRHNSKNPLAMYIHIPFCPSRCVYCHWVTSVGDSQGDIDYYLKYLEKEMDMWKEKLGTSVISPRSILIGGGTPSLLSPAQIERLLKSITSRFDLSKCSQFSLEPEPKTILGNSGMKKLKIMKNYGINRISLGVNSFDDKILKTMGRPHNREDAIKAIKQVRAAGFESISIDLVYGFPGDTFQKWIRTLKTAISLDIDAYQLYRLRIVPHGDKIGMIKKQFDKSPESFSDLEKVYIMKELGILISYQNGFNEYFRRILSKSPRHISYYLRDYCCGLYDVIGMGISSWSNLQGRLAINTGESLGKYYSYIDKGKLPIHRGKIRTKDDEKRRALVMPLKSCGVSKMKYKEKIGLTLNDSFGEKIKRLKDLGFLEEDDKRLSLTQKGCFFADEVMIQFYHRDYIPFPKTVYADGILNPYK
jgi:oxygen-independent coproporphyrinogen III oxidase